MAGLRSLSLAFIVLGLVGMIGLSSAQKNAKTKEECVTEFVNEVDKTRTEKDSCPAGEKLYMCLLDINGPGYVPSAKEQNEMESTITNMMSTYFGVDCKFDFERLLREWGDKNHSGAKSAFGVTWWNLLAAIGVSMATLVWKW